MSNPIAADLAVRQIVSANRLYNQATSSVFHRSCRPQWALLLKREGRTCYTFNDRQIVADSLHPVLLPRGSSYAWRCLEAGECLIIEFDLPGESSEILSFTVSDNAFILTAFQCIERNLYHPAPEAQLECFHKLYGVLLQLMKTRPREYAPREKQRLVQPAMDHITENFCQPDITNDSLAALCGISTVYFRKCFEAVYGISPIRYLHRYRTQRARDILSSDYSSITQTAESVGYASVYHFSKMFKLYTGVSPSRYAAACRRK